MKAKVYCEYIIGNLKHGHKEIEIDKDFEEEFKAMSDEEKVAYISEEGRMVIDNFSVDDYELDNDTLTIE